MDLSFITPWQELIVTHFLFLQGNRNSVLDDQPMFEGDNKDRPTLNYGTTTSRLYIDCVTPQDAGKYMCVADRTDELVI